MGVLRSVSAVYDPFLIHLYGDSKGARACTGEFDKLSRTATTLIEFGCPKFAHSKHVCNLQMSAATVFLISNGARPDESYDRSRTLPECDARASTCYRRMTTVKGVPNAAKSPLSHRVTSFSYGPWPPITLFCLQNENNR